MSGNIDGGVKSIKTTKAELKVKRICTEPRNKYAIRNDKDFSRPLQYLKTTNKSKDISKKSNLRRSTSLITISSDTSTPRGSNLSTSGCSSCIEDERPENWRLDQLRWKVLYSFSKNLCRKRKQQLDDINDKLNLSSEAASKMNIQVSLLKSIIRSDETIRETWKRRLQDVKQILESALQENNRLKNEFETAVQNMEKLKEKINYLETENNNLKNTQILIKSECSAFEEQLNKERNANSVLRHEAQHKEATLANDLEKRANDNKSLKNEIMELKKILEDKSFQSSEFECNLLNTTRLLQNSSKEIQHLNKESLDLRKTNKLLKDEIISLKKSMSLLENNQEQIYKYFNLNIK